MKINLGSGYKKYEGFINIDGDINCSPDYLVNLEKDTLPFDDNSVSYIIAEHILEHIGDGFFHLIQEIYRVSKNDTIIDIKVPHWRHEVFLADPTHKRPITPLGLLLFSKKANYDDIKQNGHASKLGIMYNVDFDIVDVQYILDPYYGNIVKENSDKENDRLSREVNNFFIECDIKLIVRK